MTSLLQEGGRAISAIVGLLMMAFSSTGGRSAESALIAGAVLFGAATISAQLAKLAELRTSDLSKK